jgi:putative endonuclease
MALSNKTGYVYMMTNQNQNVIYTGVTTNLPTRVWEHKNHVHPKSFTSKYKCDKLVWFEGYVHIEDAIEREKQIKAGNRARKVSLINSINPLWNDLSDTF